MNEKRIKTCKYLYWEVKRKYHYIEKWETTTRLRTPKKNDQDKGRKNMVLVDACDNSRGNN
jgi:hypothetical protein